MAHAPPIALMAHAPPIAGSSPPASWTGTHPHDEDGRPVGHSSGDCLLGRLPFDENALNVWHQRCADCAQAHFATILPNNVAPPVSPAS